MRLCVLRHQIAFASGTRRREDGKTFASAQLCYIYDAAFFVVEAEKDRMKEASRWEHKQDDINSPLSRIYVIVTALKYTLIFSLKLKQTMAF